MDSMTSYFTLGMKKNWGTLSLMQTPGFYWINADRKIDAEYICQESITALFSDANVAILHSSDTPDFLSSDLSAISVKEIPLFIYPEQKSAIQHLNTDLMRSLKTKNRYFILLTQSSLWQQFSTEELHAWIEQMHQWINTEKSTLLVLSYGLHTDQLNKQLASQHRMLNGLSQYYWHEDISEYELSWWATETRLVANESLKIQNNDKGWSLQTNKKQQSLLYCDELSYFANTIIMEGVAPPSEHWHLFETNELLVHHAQQAQAATVIFSLKQNNQIKELATQIYYLRKHCGDALKIVIRELSTNVRDNDERLLLACGANLIIPQSISLPRFLTLLEGLQGQTFSRHIANNVEKLITTMQPLQKKGFIQLKQFIDIILSRMNTSELPYKNKGILVKLVTEKGIDIQQALALCKLKRWGDFVSITDQNLWLFLSTCTANDVETALNFIFQQPLNLIFSNQISWSIDIDIIAEAERLKTEYKRLLEPLETTPDEHWSEPLSPMPLPRRIPKLINLITSKGQSE